MHNALDAGHLADYPPQVVFQVLLANNLTSFTEFAFGRVRPGVVFKPNWHFEAVTEKLSQVACGDIRRLIITLPPRSLKSLCASVALPAWFLGRQPCGSAACRHPQVDSSSVGTQEVQRSRNARCQRRRHQFPTANPHPVQQR